MVGPVLLLDAGPGPRSVFYEVTRATAGHVIVMLRTSEATTTSGSNFDDLLEAAMLVRRQRLELELAERRARRRSMDVVPPAIRRWRPAAPDMPPGHRLPARAPRAHVRARETL